MPDLVLHHYDGSPFSEKLRLILGFKGLAWKSVTVPVIMPKPDLTALTGGYRRTPVMQCGADIYCDTALIAQWLDGLQPARPLYPAHAPLAPLLAQWADFTLFWSVIPFTMQPAGMATIFKGVPPEAVKAFGADRQPFTAGLKRQTVADAAAAVEGYLDALEGQLGQHDYLFGSAPCIADFSVAHNGWYVRRGGPATAAVIERRPRLNAWLDRMLAIGHGHFERIAAADAIAIAARGERVATVVAPGLGFDAGQPVTVAATDYGTDPVSGDLVGLSNDEVVIARRDERAGLVHVHFPRRGFQLKAVQS